MACKDTRDYENVQRAAFKGVGEYDIPRLAPLDECDVENWISYNYARGCENPEEHGVHFFVDDYQFLRLWKDPDRYLEQLGRFQAVCTPDFSLYTDYPKAVQVYNHYRKHWLGAYWQSHWIKVLPTICWAGPESYDWCFDGEPVNSCVAVSSVGTQNSEESKRLFLDGYNEMLRRLQPTKIIMYGQVPEGCEGNIQRVSAFVEKWRK